jgi:hypothetical protein
MKTLAEVDSSEQRQAMEVIEKFGGLGQVQPQGAETVSQTGIPL